MHITAAQPSFCYTGSRRYKNVYEFKLILESLNAMILNIPSDLALPSFSLLHLQAAMLGQVSQCQAPPLPYLAYWARVKLHKGTLFPLSCNRVQEEGEEVTNMADALQLKAEEQSKPRIAILGSSSAHRPYRAVSCF